MSKHPTTIPEENEQEGLLIAHFGQYLIVEDQNGVFHNCAARKKLGSLVTGDRVMWQPLTNNTGVITTLKPRQSVITRFNKKLKQKPIIANVDQLVIVVALKPSISQTTIDRYLIIAEYFKLKSVLVVNKWDLKDESAFAPNLDYIKQYQSVVDEMVFVSSKQEQGLDSLLSVMQDKTNLLAGQSGVGKSSLISSFIPDLKLRTNELSKNGNLGKHTTSASQLYHLPNGGDVIDSPGIRQFYLTHLDENAIQNGFPELNAFKSQCQFRDCHHSHEPNCAIRQAIAQGLVQQFRLDNYHALLAEHEEENR